MADEASYIDYEAFLDPHFSPQAFANTLILTTNNPSDTPLDLSTPLSRVLFDLQEIDTHLHTLTTASALPLLSHTDLTTTAGTHIAASVSTHLSTLTSTYARLETEVIQRHDAAEQTRITAQRLWATVRLGRSVARALTLARQLELHMTEIGAVSGKKEDHRALVRAADVLLTLRDFLQPAQPGGETEGLERIKVINTLKSDMLRPAELKVTTRAQQIVREFSVSSSSAASTTTTSPTYAQSEDTKARTVSALSALYLLSPAPTSSAILLTTSLQSYLTAAHSSSVSALARALANLPTLERTLLEISARSQNIVALQALLASIPAPTHPVLSATTDAADAAPSSLLSPLLAVLDTASLSSHFWRALAGGVAPRVQELVGRGGAAARALRVHRERVRGEVRGCVIRGSGDLSGKGCEREVAVMVGAVVGGLGR